MNAKHMPEVFDDGSRNDRWLLDNGMFVTRYEAVPGCHLEHFIAYRPVVNVPKGRMPWTVNNRRLREREFQTLDEAIQFAAEHEAREAA